MADADTVRQWRHEAQRFRDAMLAALDELGVPGPDYPAPIANAVTILRRALHIDPLDNDGFAGLPWHQQNWTEGTQPPAPLDGDEFERDRRQGHVTSDPAIVKNPLHHDGTVGDE